MLVESGQLTQVPASEPTDRERNREQIVRAVLDEVRPNLKRDGGDCELLGIEGSKIMVRLTGACVLCKLASATLEGIQSKLIERLGEFVRLVPVAGAPKPRH